jgi:hypothetical protein
MYDRSWILHRLNRERNVAWASTGMLNGANSTVRKVASWADKVAVARGWSGSKRKGPWWRRGRAGHVAGTSGPSLVVLNGFFQSGGPVTVPGEGTHQGPAKEGLVSALSGRVQVCVARTAEPARPAEGKRRNSEESYALWLWMCRADQPQETTVYAS